MTPERWEKIDSILDEVLELPDAERKKILADRCGDDKKLLNDIQNLIRSDKKSIEFLENSAIRIVAKNLATEKKAFPKENLLGKTHKGYKFEKLIGEGGMGKVYLAYDNKLNRKVAIKILPSGYTANQEKVLRFEREANAISALNHPNIVTIYDVGKFDSTNYITTEYVEGKSLRELINEKLSLHETLDIVIQCCNALSAAHQAGIIHRDIKPENIIVRPDGYVKVLDFGLAKLTTPIETSSQYLNETIKGTIMGTPAYMSPEQASGELVDNRTDLWSIGVVLYEMLTGTNPFKCEKRQTTIQAILSVNPKIPSDLNPEIHPELDQILIKALEKDPDLSYQNASDFIADLKRVKREITSSSSLSVNTETKPTQKGLYRSSSIAFAFIGIMAFLVGSWLLYNFLFSTDSNKENIWNTAKNIQLTNNSSIAEYPSLSPDGNSFVYSTTVNNQEDIFLQRVGGNNRINLTKDSPAGNFMPAFSPDGKSIAFRSDRSQSGIYIMGATGENEKNITDFGFHPSWSPDGQKIVFSDRPSSLHTFHTTASSSIWIVNVESGKKEKLDTKGDAIYPSWSPNGHRIAYWSVEEGKLGDIVTIPAEGGDPVKATTNSATDWNPIWSPYGKYLFFLSDRGGSMNIWRVAIDEKSGKVSGVPQSIPTPSEYCRHLSISRDGKRLAYNRYESQSNLLSLAFDPEKEEITSKPKWLTTGNREISVPDLSPDGEEFVVRTLNLTQEDLVIYGKDGEKKRLLTENRFNERSPKWSPDGKKIYFYSNKSGKYQIWSINSSGTGEEQITFNEKGGATTPVISPDGTKLIYSEIDGNSRQLFLLDLTKKWSEQKPIPVKMKDPEGAYLVRSWSNDDKLLVSYTNFDKKNRIQDEIGVFDLNTNTYEKMIDIGFRQFWLNDSRRFLYTRNNTIYLVDSITKSVKQLFNAPRHSVQNTNISKDNKMIFYRYLEIESDVWLIDASETMQEANSN